MNFKDIPPFTRGASYAVDISFDYLPRAYIAYVLEDGLNVNPDFQRKYVWTESQKTSFVEYMLRGGLTGRDIYTNNPSWTTGLNRDGEFVLVDGKQRLDTMLGFLNNEVKAFGLYRNQFTGRLSRLHLGFRWHINDLQTRHEVLSWYIDLNAGGTPHSPEEIERVRALRDQGLPPPPDSKEARLADAGIHREVLQEAIAARKAEAVQYRNPTPPPPPKKKRK